ncbi:MAG TPA: glycosyltransferase family 4 protein [Anaerolineales bacterium]|nr:glycosyltransferase family 4 protein [Anaerolineales bacterium]
MVEQNQALDVPQPGILANDYNPRGKKLKSELKEIFTVRILMATPRFLPHLGGVENHVSEVSRRLARSGFEVTVLATDLEGKMPPCEQMEGVTVNRVRAWPRGRDYYFAPGIYRTIVQGRWDVVHVQSYHTLVAPMAMAAARKAKIPYILTFHGGGHSSRVRSALRTSQRALLHPLLSRADRLVATASFEVSLFSKELRLPVEKFVLIPNGGDLVREPPPDGKPEGALIASIGRLERYKGHHRMIAALPLVLAERPEARLWIAGVGPYEESLRKLANKLGVEDRVEIRSIPVEDRDGLAAELSKVALVTLLSEYETHPIAALEAVAMGKSLLVTDTSGLRELAEKGLAKAIPLSSNSGQVAAAALELLRHPLHPVSYAIPTWDDCAAQLASLYRECVHSQHHGTV